MPPPGGRGGRIPNFMRFQLKAKSSEGKVNIAAIRTAEESYLAEFGAYVGVAAAIPAVADLGSAKVPFTAGSNFDTLGWAPEGQVFFQYAVAYASATPSAYTISAAADIDADNTNQVWGYVKPVTATTAGIVGVNAACVAAGVAGAQLATVGPCVATHGQSVF